MDRRVTPAMTVEFFARIDECVARPREQPRYIRAMSDVPPEEKPSPEQEERDRRSANIFLLVAAVAFIAIGIWIGDEMLKAKRADDCMSSGRRNCAPIQTPVEADPPRRVVDPRP